MSERDEAPRSRPLDELEPAKETEAALQPHMLPIEATQPAADEGLAGPGDPSLPTRRPWGRRLLAAGLGLTVAGAGAALVEALIMDALAEGGWIAWIIAGGVTLLVAGALTGLVREWLALESLDGLRKARLEAENADEDPAVAEGVLHRLRRLYRHRPDLEWAWRQVDDQKRSGLDGVALLHRAARVVLPPLARRAERIATQAVRRAAAVTAVSPFALADMAATLVIISVMLRRMLRLYGGRPGLLATWRLLRMSLAYVLASGALEFADDTLGDALGVGLASRLSRRVGTSLVNGLLTARLAVATINLIRPFPPHHDLPSARGLLGRAVVDLRRSEE